MIAGVLVVVLAVLLLLPTDRKNPPVDLHPRTENSQVEETKTETGTPVPDQQVSDTEAAVPEPAEPEPPVEVLNYHIIVGSFKHLHNASDKQDDLNARSRGR